MPSLAVVEARIGGQREARTAFMNSDRTSIGFYEAT